MNIMFYGLGINANEERVLRYAEALCLKLKDCDLVCTLVPSECFNEKGVQCPYASITHTVDEEELVLKAVAVLREHGLDVEVPRPLARFFSKS